MHKHTQISSEIKGFFSNNSNHKAVDALFRVIESLKVTAKAIGVEKASNCQFTTVQILHLLLVMPLFGVKRIGTFEDSSLSKLFTCKKDVFYRFLDNGMVNWRKIAGIVNRDIVGRLKCRADSRKSGMPVCLSIDDTDLPKRGERFELIGRVYSHVTHTSIVGFKGLFLCRTDGKTQTILDFSLHKEEGKNSDKPQGFTKKQLDRRLSRDYEDDSPVKERIDDYGKSKIKKAMEMVRAAIKDGFKFDYLLADSWFTCTEILEFIQRRHVKCHYLGMAKKGNLKYNVGDESLSANEILRRNKKNVRRCRRLKAYYLSIDAFVGRVKVRLFFKKRDGAEWRVLITTDTALEFPRAYEIYAMRWSIEVFFSDSKKYLMLGKSQTLSFASQIASVAIATIQYNILSYVKRFESYETIGGLFKDCNDQTIELSAVESIWKIILNVIVTVSELMAVDEDKLIRLAIQKNQDLANLAYLCA